MKMSIFQKRINILPLIGYDYKYFIDNKGIVYKNNKKLKGGISKQGYLRYGLKINNKWIKEYAHRLVAINFIKNDDPLKKIIINHIDGNKLNNDVKNLEWCTYLTNNQHAISNNLINTSNENHFNCKLKNSEVLEIRKLYFETNINMIQLSKIYNVSNAQISRIINHKERKNVNI